MTLRKSAAPPQFNGLRRTLDVYSGFNVQEQRISPAVAFQRRALSAGFAAVACRLASSR
jgi:hypothetical protein